MERYIKKIKKVLTAPRVNYQPLVEVLIFKDSLLHNLKEYRRQYPNLEIAPVLKSNAYGHGLVQVAEILDNEGLPFFVVDSFYEALTLRQHGIKTKVLVLGYTRAEQVSQDSLKDCSFGITSLEYLKEISASLTSPKNFHLKIDTGMHRQGVLISEIEEAIDLIRANKQINLEGVSTHFADAETSGSAFTILQIERWNKLQAQFKQEFPSVKYFHVSNTAGVVYSDKTQANVCRLGAGLYGMDTAVKSKVSLKPALEVRSLISQIKELSTGDPVGYDLTFKSKKNARIAIVPVGYFEGVDRRLSNKGSFKVGEQFCPIIGRVSMNMTAIDVTDLKDVNVKQPVIIFSSDPKDQNSIENAAHDCDTIQREILVHIPPTLRRIVV